jgi:hypothetical protein
LRCGDAMRQTRERERWCMIGVAFLWSFRTMILLSGKARLLLPTSVVWNGKTGTVYW